MTANIHVTIPMPLVWFLAGMAWAVIGWMLWYSLRVYDRDGRRDWAWGFAFMVAWPVVIVVAAVVIMYVVVLG